MHPYYYVVHAVDVASCVTILLGIHFELARLGAAEAEDSKAAHLIPTGHCLMAFGQVLRVLPEGLAFDPLYVLTYVVVASYALALEWKRFPNIQGVRRILLACLLSLAWACFVLWDFPCWVDWLASFRGTMTCGAIFGLVLIVVSDAFLDETGWGKEPIPKSSVYPFVERYETALAGVCVVAFMLFCHQSAQTLLVAFAACCAYAAKPLDEGDRARQSSKYKLARMAALSIGLFLAYQIGGAIWLCLTQDQVSEYAGFLLDGWRSLGDWMSYALVPYGTELDKISALQTAVAGDSDALLWLIRFRYGVWGVLMMLGAGLAPMAVICRVDSSPRILRTVAWTCVAALWVMVLHAVGLLSFDAMFSVVVAVLIGWAMNWLSQSGTNRWNQLQDCGELTVPAELSVPPSA